MNAFAVNNGHDKKTCEAQMVRKSNTFGNLEQS